jgi:hypothetical protein
MAIKLKTNGSAGDATNPTTITLADILISLERETSLSATRLTGLRSTRVQ